MGKQQRNRNINEIKQTFEFLSHNANLGTLREDICANYYCYPQGSHLIFYIVSAEGIDIIGIPHQAMDIAKYFG
jgi:toxin ParE1/3/4